MHIEAELAYGMSQLRLRRTSARLPISRVLLDMARADWALNTSDFFLEQRWRQASLIEGALQAASGSWRTALGALNENPYGWHDRDRPAVTSGCEALAGLMATGRATCFWQLGMADKAGWSAVEALDYFSRGESPRPKFNRWQGVAALILSASGIPSASRKSTWALELLNQEFQPKTYNLARYLNGEGHNLMLSDLRRAGIATLPANEVLYFFDE